MFRNVASVGLILLSSCVQGQTIFKQARGQADVFYDNSPLATTYESSYQALKSGMENAVSRDFVALRASALGGNSFVQASFAPALQDPAVNIFVDTDQGKLVDVDRLRADLRAFADAKLESLENDILGKNSFLGLNVFGDEIPEPGNVLDVNIEEPIHGFGEAAEAEELTARGTKLRQLEAYQQKSRRALANLIRSTASKLNKINA